MIEVVEGYPDGSHESTLIPDRDMFCTPVQWPWGETTLEVMDRGGFHLFAVPHDGRLEITAFLGVE
jgi:hypothetical protein